MDVQCTVCRHGYQAPSGESTCPQCGRINVRLRTFDGVPTWAWVLLIGFLIFVALVALATYLNS